MAHALAAPSAARDVRRRHYLVDRGFQLKYALLMAATGIVVAAAFGMWLHEAHVQATALFAPDPGARALVERSDRLLFTAFGAISVLFAIALALLGIVITHRVAGPVFVMGHYVKVLSEGRFPRMRTLRRSDDLKTFFRTFIAAVDAMKNKEAHHAAMLEETVERMRAALPRVPELGPSIDALAEAARERRAALAQDDLELTPLAVPTPRKRAGA